MPKDMQTTEEFTVDAQKLRSDLDKVHNKKRASSESSSALGQLRKSTVEGLGCHKDAFASIEKIDAKSEEDRADYLRSFIPMFEAMLPDWQEEMADMLDGLEEQKAPTKPANVEKVDFGGEAAE